MPDYTHLNALFARYDAERERLEKAQAKGPKGRNEERLRKVWLDQISKEIVAERTFLHGKVPEEIENMTDDELLADLLKENTCS